MSSFLHPFPRKSLTKGCPSAGRHSALESSKEHCQLEGAGADSPTC